MSFDDLTEKERAQIDVERLSHDACNVVNRLCELRNSPVHAPFFASEAGNLNQAMTGLQLLCSADRVERSKPKLVRVS